MELSIQQVAAINWAINMDSEQKPRRYAIAELTTATDIFRELKKCTEGDKIIGGEVNFSTDQKAFILKTVKELSWSLQEGDAVQEVISLLS